MEISKIKNLIEKISLINIKHKEFARLTGENFNIFKILRLETNEVKKHSAFLCELLDPKGSHYCGKIFLDLFIEQLKEKVIETNTNLFKILNSFNTDKAIIKSEEFIGLISEDKTEGGRIDIVIKENNGDNVIIIENKIYAKDREYQLLRYKNAYKNPAIFYLTLDGKEPSVTSTNNESQTENNIVCISYREDIVLWLESCIKEVAQIPIIRESIIQYLYLIKNLTGQSMNKVMEKEIINIMMSSQENIDAAFKIKHGIDQVVPIFNEILKNQISEIEIDDIKTEEIKNNQNFSDFIFKLTDPNKHEIRLSFSQGGYGKVIVGITADQNIENKNGLPKIEDYIKEKDPTKYSFKHSEYWPIYHELYCDCYKSFQFYQDIKEGELKKTFQEFIQIIIEGIKHLQNNLS